jgi:hypothetical protein
MPKHPRPQKIYIILRGQYYDDMPHIHGTAFTKKDAEKLCRASGHKWSKEDQLWLNDEGDGSPEGTRWWLKVVAIEPGKRGYSDRVSYGRPLG